MTIPKLLRKAPILEAIAEVRFASGAPNGVVGTVLPGLLFGDLKAEYPDIQGHPSAQIPAAFRAQNPELRYLPSTTLKGDGRSLNVGDCVLALSFAQPYPGWESFRAAILKVWELTRKSGLVSSIERFSLKYVNMIDAPQDSNHFDRSTIRLSLGDHVVTCEPTTVRTEIRRDRFIAVASIVTQAIAVGDPAHYGFVVDLDVICNGPFDSGWDMSLDSLTMHITSKKKYFLAY